MCGSFYSYFFGFSFSFNSFFITFLFFRVFVAYYLDINGSCFRLSLCCNRLKNILIEYKENWKCDRMPIERGPNTRGFIYCWVLGDKHKTHNTNQTNHRILRWVPVTTRHGHDFGMLCDVRILFADFEQLGTNNTWREDSFIFLHS